MGRSGRGRAGIRGAVAPLVALCLLTACGKDEAELASAGADTRAEASVAAPVDAGAKQSGPKRSGSERGASDEPVTKGEPRRGALRGGGFAQAVPGTDAPDRKVDTGPRIEISETTPDIAEIERLVREVERIAREHANAQPVPTGGDLAAALGSFTYRYYANGTVDPDPRWVAANIRTEPVPILGTVTCHRVMLPQLRGALQEVVDRGLADEIHPEEYAGCYYPRFINRDPADGLSLHTWGIAVDLNVPGNLRGTRGEIDRTVVAILKKWGFDWGGDWNYTDPMHFELGRLVKAE